MEYIKSKFEGYLWDLVQFKRVRSVYALSRAGDPELYVKIYHPDSLIEQLRNFVYPKTLQEMHTLEKLRSAGVPVPETVDHLRHGFVSALVTKAVHPSTSLSSLPENRQLHIMLNMATLLLKKGFFYKDCHAGNVILDGAGEPVLVDAYAVAPVRDITEKLVVRLMGQIASAYQIPDVTLESRVEDLLPSSDAPSVIREIRTWGLLARRRLVQRRVKRSLREGSFSREIQTENYRAFVVRGHPVELERVILEHGQNLTDRAHILKFQHKTQLSVVDDLCVKSYARPKPFTTPYGLRSWKGLLTLLFNRIPVADPVAVVVGRGKTSIIITGLVRERDLNRVLFHEYPSMAIHDKMEIARELGKLLATLHVSCIYHADLKASNIKLLKNPFRFILLDTDKVSQGKSISRDKRLRNLLQINNSIPRHVKKSVRMAFVREYARMTGDDPKEVFREVWELSEGETIAYRTDEGDRSESWQEQK